MCLVFFLQWEHPNNIEICKKYQTKTVNSIIFNVDKYLLHHIRTARVEGSGSIYRT